MKTAATNKKVRELINLVKDGFIVPRPEFQRRLVWSRDDKNLFIDTILRNYPFPEIYLADGDVDLETGKGTQLLVDGLQRVSTLVQYFEGDSELHLTSVPPYNQLQDEEKKSFLQYDVAVRDLGTISKIEIVEVFKRLNATKYSLLDIEVNNAVYAGALKSYAQEVADKPFFEIHRVFNTQDLKRMGDLRYALTIVLTMMTGYFNRDDRFEDALARFNDEFPQGKQIETRVENTLDFIEECGFEAGSRLWRKADLFTLIIELDSALNTNAQKLAPSAIVERLNRFYATIDGGGLQSNVVAATYYKAALQASNDRINRVRRGLIVGELLAGSSDQVIQQMLEGSHLL